MSLAGKTRRQVLTEFREAEILAAARRIFAERGFSAATVDLIAAAAGIAKGTLYLYFASKDEIFWAAIRSRFQSLLDQTKAELQQISGTREKVRAALRVRFAFLHADEEFLRMYFTEFGHMCRPSGQFQQPFRALYREGAEFLASVLEEGVAAGELRPLPAFETAMALMDLSRDVFAMRLIGAMDHNAESPNPDFDEERFVFELFWNGVAASAPRPPKGQAPKAQAPRGQAKGQAQ